MMAQNRLGITDQTEDRLILAAELEFKQCLEKLSDAVVLSSVEIESDDEITYRVWGEMRLLGVLRRDSSCLWVAEPKFGTEQKSFEKFNDAAIYIIEVAAKA